MEGGGFTGGKAHSLLVSEGRNGGTWHPLQPSFKGSYLAPHCQALPSFQAHRQIQGAFFVLPVSTHSRPLSPPYTPSSSSTISHAWNCKARGSGW